MRDLLRKSSASNAALRAAGATASITRPVATTTFATRLLGLCAELVSANSFAGYGVFEYYRREAEKVSGGQASAPGKLPPPDFGWNFYRPDQ